MGKKKIYLTKKQLKRVNEDDSSLNISVDMQDGQNPSDALGDAKRNTAKAAGPQIADNATYSFKGSELNCGRSISKKKIEEARISNIISNGQLLTKKELSSKLKK